MLQQDKKAKAFFLKLNDFCFYRNNENNRRNEVADLFSVSVVLYDRACPVCRVEMERLKRRDRHERLVLLDISSPVFNEQTWGISHADASGALHVLTPGNKWLVGMSAIRHVYHQVGLGWMMAPSAWPVIAPLADRLYRYIAPNRYAISRWLGFASTSPTCTDSVCAGASIRKGDES